MSKQEFCLTRKNLYMLPTRHGLMFGLILFAMLVMAVNYNNSLAYLMSFMLFSAVSISMLYTHRNLAGICISYGACQPAFAGNKLSYTLVLSNQVQRNRFDIGIDIEGEESRRRNFSEFETLLIECHTRVTKRGWYSLPPVQVNTRFPLGLLFSWSKPATLEKKCLVYPQPAPWQEFPIRYTDGSANQAHQKLASDDYSGLRQFRVGDPPQHIDWKAYARGKGLYSKEFLGGESPDMIFRWEDTQGDREFRISVLTRWVVEAAHLGIRFGLVLPGIKLPPASNDNHTAECLKQLALY
jgi:uncharacterized protein (DUF58 family)